MALNKAQQIKSPKLRKVDDDKEVKETAGRGVKGRVNTLVRCLLRINQFPALNKWKGGADIGIAHIKGQKKLVARGKAASHTYAPLTLNDIQNALESCQTIGSSLLLITYLALGTRSGDGEKASYTHILGGRYQLDRIQSKTRTQNQPVAPLVLKVLLRCMLDAGLKFEPLPSSLDKRRFRPTCAVGLCLSGVTTLNVAARTGHATQMMVIRHYARVTPSDYRHRDFRAYSGVGLLRVEGETINSDESAYDSYLLKLLLDTGKKFGLLEQMKRVLKQEMGQANISDDNMVVNY